MYTSIMKGTAAALLLAAVTTATYAQDRRDAANYIEQPKNEFFEKIKKDNEDFFTKKPEPKMRMYMD